jgi:hypothetical protein
MKKLLFIFLGISITLGSFAQKQETVKKAEEKDLRQDIRVKQAHKKAVWRDLAHLKVKKAGKEQDVVNAKRKDIHQDTKELRALGEKHPTQDAKKVIRKQKAAAKENS